MHFVINIEMRYKRMIKKSLKSNLNISDLNIVLWGH